MSSRDPVQLAIVLDGEDITPIDEVVGRLPERDDAPRIFLLSRHRGGNIRRGQPIDWTRQADAVVDVIQEARRAVPKDGRATELYVWGQGPLPLFVQLGQELADWASPLTFFGRRADGSWDELPLSSEVKPAAEQPFFDVVTGLEQTGLPDGGRLCVFVSTRGAPPERESIDRFLRTVREDRRGLVEIRTSGPRLLDRETVTVAAEELRRALAEVQQQHPRAGLGLFVAGPAALALLVGRALPPSSGQTDILTPHFEQQEYRPALVLPWSHTTTAEEAPERVSVLLAYAEPGAREVPLHEELANHLRAPAFAPNVDLEVLDAHAIPPGVNRQDEVRRVLDRSDIVVPYLSAEFRVSDIGRLVEQSLATSRPVIPILERPLVLKDTPWQDLILLPRDRRPLRKRGDRDAVLVEITEEIRRKAEEIAANRRDRRERVGNLVVKRPRTGSGTVPITEVLDAMERDLQALPRLRFTLERRSLIWERLIDALDERHPDQNVKQRLHADTQAHANQMRRFLKDLKEPAFFRPEDPLDFVLALLEEQAAARWLYLGAVEVAPTVSFPRWGNGAPEVDLAERLKPYTPHLTDRQRRALERSQLLHQLGCPGLLAVLSRDHQETTEELELAGAVLADFRLGMPMEDLFRGHDPEKFYSAALLNLFGAEALWRGDLAAAERAYGLAQQRAEQDRHSLAEWVAVNGLVLTHLWHTMDWLSAPAGRANAETAEQSWRRRREELEREPEVRRVLDYTTGAILQAEREVVESLQQGLAEGKGQPRPPYELKQLLLDQEEMGAAPMVRGETAEALGTSQLLQANGPAAELRQTVATLCLYGVSADKSWRFFSAALDPLNDGFSKICVDVLRTGRTTGEWAARLSFLEQYGLDMPPALASAARSFYTAALDQFENRADEDLPRLTGRSFGSTMGWAIMDRIIEQVFLLAAHLTDGVDLIQHLLDRPIPRCWQAALERLHVPLWLEWFQIGALNHAALETLARTLRARLAHPLAAPIFAKTRVDRGRFLFSANIPMGLAKVLGVLRFAGQDPAVIQSLHHDLCRMLEAGMEREPELYQLSFFTDDVFKWFKTYPDEAGGFLARQVDRHIERLTEHDTVSTYSEGLSCLAHQAAYLTPSHWERLGELLLRHREPLLEDVETRAYAVRPLLWLSAGLLNDGPSELHDIGCDLLRHSAPLPEGLVAAVAASPESLGPLAETLEQAVLHCLRGLLGVPMPWFTSPKRRPRIEDSDEMIYQGLGAVHNRIHFHHATPPPAGWRRWLEPALAHCYSRNPRVAARALVIMERALHHGLDGLDIGSGVQALCWALSRPHREVRDQALFTSLRHRQRLVTPGDALEIYIARFVPPPSISTDHITRIVNVPIIKNGKP